MGYVQEYGNGRFRARRRVDGKMQSKTFATRAAAWTWLEGEPAGSSPPVGSPSAGPAPFAAPARVITLGQFLDDGGYPTTHMRPTGKAFTDSIVGAHVRPRWGEISLGAITHHDLQRWVSELDNGSRSPATIKHIAKVTKRVLDAAVRQQLIASNPAHGLVTPRIDHEEMRFINTDQITSLYDAMDEQYRPIVMVCAFAGLRIGEALGLRWGRVDLFAGRIDVAEIVTESSGKLHFGPPKTRSGRRSVSIPRRAVNALADHSRRSWANVAPDALVFTAPNGGPVRYGNFRRRVWVPAVDKAGLSGLRPHDLRHTAVALWIAAGANPKEVSVRAGHTSASFTLDRYGHLFPSQDAALTARLDTLIEQGVK